MKKDVKSRLLRTKYLFDRESDRYEAKVLSGNIGLRSIDSYERHIVDKEFNARGSRIVLDVGVGTGRFSRMLARKGFQIVGIDISKRMLKMSIRNIDSACSFVQCDSMHLPFRKCVFDGIVCIRTFKYFSDPTKAVGEFARVIKGHAKIVVQFENAQCYQSCAKRVYYRSIIYNVFSVKGAFEFMRDSGLDVIRIVRGPSVPYFIYRLIDSHFLMKMVAAIELNLSRYFSSFLGSNFVVVAKSRGGE